MKVKNKIVVLILVMVIVVSCAIMLAGCKDIEDILVGHPSNITVKSMSDLAIYMGEENIYPENEGVSDIIIQFDSSRDTTEDRAKPPYKLDKNLLDQYSWVYSDGDLKLEIYVFKNNGLTSSENENTENIYNINGLEVWQEIRLKGDGIRVNSVTSYFIYNEMKYAICNDHSKEELALEDLENNAVEMREYISTFRKY